MSNPCKQKIYPSCQAVYEAGCPSSTYRIALLGNSPQQMYCWMDKASKTGWTLVWRYTFSNYKSFTSGSNYITTIPSWHDHESFKGNGVGTLEGKVSTTAPANLGQNGALDFGMWDQIGSEFFVMSNINSHYRCKPKSGSLTMPKAGSISCTVVKPAATAAKLGCAKKAPNSISWSAYGPILGPAYYYWDAESSGNWPTHDPCGQNKPQHVKGVSNPYGAVFIKTDPKKLACGMKKFATCNAAYKAGCPTGTYKISIAGKTTRMFCYMDKTRKAGWTLVWRYGFSNYKSFTSGNNHIPTIPTWHKHSSFKGNKLSTLEAKVSTTPPESPAKNGALDFKLWPDIGTW